MGRFSFEDEEEHITIRCNKRRNQSIEDEDQRKLQKFGEESEEICEIKGGISVTIDPDALECFICCEPLQSPLYQKYFIENIKRLNPDLLSLFKTSQRDSEEAFVSNGECENGHVACSLCCTKLPQNKCPTCSHSINFTRCRALEKIIESIKSPCIYSKYGCNRTLPYIDVSPHQETCTYAPCFCPMSSCTFCGIPVQVSTHFGTYHRDSAIEFQYEKPVKISLDREKPFIVLREEHGFLFLLLNERFMDMGNSLSVACIQLSSKECDFVYEIMVGGAESLLQLKASVENVRKWVGIYPRKSLLLVPENFCPPDVDISVNVCIRKKKTLSVVG